MMITMKTQWSVLSLFSLVRIEKKKKKMQVQERKKDQQDGR